MRVERQAFELYLDCLNCHRQTHAKPGTSYLCRECRPRTGEHHDVWIGRLVELRAKHLAAPS